MKENQFNICVYTHEPVAGLQRIMALFSRNRILLNELQLKKNKQKNINEILIRIESNPADIQKIINKMLKIIELLKVELK